MTNAPWYVSNHTLHFDLRIPYVYMVFREWKATHRTTLDSHPKLPHGTNSAPTEQQAFKKKMDILRDTLRKRRWMPP